MSKKIITQREELSVLLGKAEAFLSRRLCATFPKPATIRLMRHLNGIHLSSTELEPIVKSIKKRRPCSLLVFGLGNDSQFWVQINEGGKTIFIEDQEHWYQVITQRDPRVNAYLVNFQTKRSQWRDLLDKPELLKMTLPQEIVLTCWDIILVDGPNGFDDENPGRMKSIYLASRLPSKTAEIFVHDCDRPLEQAYCDKYLQSAHLVSEVGKLRHYCFK